MATRNSTLTHITIEKALFYKGKPEDFHFNVTQRLAVEELLEVGLEYVYSKDRILFFRKR